MDKLRFEKSTARFGQIKGFEKMWTIVRLGLDKTLFEQKVLLTEK